MDATWSPLTISSPAPREEPASPEEPRFVLCFGQSMMKSEDQDVGTHAGNILQIQFVISQKIMLLIFLATAATFATRSAKDKVIAGSIHTDLHVIVRVWP
jgi:hypothetical protein